MQENDFLSAFVIVCKKVEEALEANQAVVALESTIISHGMPYPNNIETAISLENMIREEGAVPATIALLNGKIHIGLNEDELEILGNGKGNVCKVSRRDLPFVISKKMNGATTVAATMILADLLGIRVFATGGIGGVHRGGEVTMDVSADLQELANTNVAVVSAGVKSILDIPRTLEYLETFGVPVIGYQTEEFPAFYTRKSGSKVDYPLHTPEAIADVMKTKWNLGLDGGLLVANPIPEPFEMNKDEIDTAIKQALSECESLGILGKEITPFLLSRVKELTQGNSLFSNIKLVENNARLAAKIAVAYHEIIP